MLIFVLSYLFYFIFYYYPLKFVCFLMRNRIVMDSDERGGERGTGRIRGGGPIIEHIM